MRYYEVKLERCVNYSTYLVRARNIPEAHDKALKAEELAQKESGAPSMVPGPSVVSIKEFCDDSAVLT